MQTEHSNIPNEIFDWLETTAFDALAIHQQETVLQFFSKAAYNDLHTTASQLKDFAKPSIDNKSKLMDAFDEQYADKKKTMHLPATYLWRAAVLLLLVGVGGLQWALMKHNNGVASIKKTVLDTVVVVKEIAAPAIRMHDTVWMAMNQKAEKKPIQHYAAEPSVALDSNQKYPSGVHVLTIDDMDATPNRQRGNSMKEDTLMKQFQYAMM